MSCCGKNREKMQSVSVTRPLVEPPMQGVPLEYIGGTAIRVQGPATGRVYVFSPGAPLAVDRRDSDALRRTRLFR